MAKNQLALRRYRVILRILRRQGKHASKDIHMACVNCGIEVGLRTIQDDLGRLRDDDTIFGQNLNIEYDGKTKKWYSTGIPKEIFTLLELEDGEVTALLFYAKTINQYSGYPIFEEMSQAIRKVIDNSNISDDVKELFEKEALLETEKHQPLKGIELITDILDAIHNRNILSIRYQKFEGDKVKTHDIRPIILKEDKQMWYIIGENVKHQNLITLALDRIISLNFSTEQFDPVEFNSEEYFKYSFGITVSDEEPVDVIISFTPYQGNYLRTLPIHSTQEILVDNGNEFKIKVTVKPSYEFFSKIYSYGSDAIVLSPESVVAIVSKEFKQATSNYN